MKKLIIIITLLMAFVVNAQQKEYPLIMGTWANAGGDGNLLESGLSSLIDVNNISLAVLSGKFTLTQTGAQVQTILDGTFTGDFIITDGNITLSVGKGITQASFGRPSIIFTSNSEITIQTSNQVDNSFIALDVRPVTGAGIDGEVRIGDTGTNNEYTKIDSLGKITTPLGINFGADAQGDDDYEISLPGITALNAGLMVVFTANTANTGAATFEISEVGDLDTIKKLHDQDLANGDIEAGQVVVLVFDGINWQMTSQLAQ